MRGVTLRNSIVLTIWIGVVAIAIVGGFDQLAVDYLPEDPTIVLLSIAFLIPPLVFGVLGVFLRGYPFDIPALRARIDDKYGKDTYCSFLNKLKPLLLLTIASVACGATLMVNTLQSDGARGGYLLGTFYLAGAFGFWILRAILRRRGLAME